jgi:heat-inducible transcriptional repressor
MTRQDEILKLIVEHFIKTAEPVGSKTLQEAYRLKISSATIRNDMLALEKDGYLEKTHTSSGRVPSEKGYQYYVEHLRDTEVDDGLKFALANVLQARTKSVEEVMKESCEILSHMTNLASVVIGPSANEERLASVQLIPLGNNTATAVFVTDKGYVENKTFIIDSSLKMDEVTKTVKILNDRLAGSSIAELVPKMEAMKPALTDYLVGQEVIYQAILEAFVKFADERMELYGKDALYNQPEFLEDTKKLKQVLELLDDPKAYRKAVEEARSASGGIGVHIGTEKEGMEDLAIVSAKVQIPGDPGAALTVFGPSRMDYEKVVSALRYMTSQLDKYFLAQTKGEKESCPITKKPASPNKTKPADSKKKPPK